MVQLLRREPIVVYKLCDGTGRPIGRVVEPRGVPVVNRGAATVLLLREPGVAGPMP
jgi:hypothetical protein